MSTCDTVFTGAKLIDGSVSDIGVSGGRIASISPAGAGLAASETVDLGGALVVPGFIEGHIHLDTSFYGDAWVPRRPCTNGFDVHERVAFQDMANAAPMDVRARKQLAMAMFTDRTVLDLVIANVQISGRDHRVDLGISAGRIAAIEAHIASDAPKHDMCGHFAFGGFVDSHIHLDKACILDRCLICEGTLQEAVRETAKAKAGFTAEDVYARAARVVEKAIANGTTAMRTFVEIDPRAGFRSFEAIGQIKRDYAWAIDIDICAFAQEGLTNEPQTEAMLAEALAAGANLVGGCPYTDPDPETHIRLIFDLAERFGVEVDFHLDFDLNPAGSTIDAVVSETRRRGYGRRVSLGHVTKLSAMAPETVRTIADRLAEAGIGVTVLPATDMFLLGRDRDHLVPRGIAPAMLLRDRGVTVTVATNNVLNPFTPYGDASLCRMGNLFANAAQLSRDEDLAAAFDMVTTDAARLMRRDYGIRFGGPADIVVMDAAGGPSAIREICPPLAGWKNGRQSFLRPRPRLLRPDLGLAAAASHY